MERSSLLHLYSQANIQCLAQSRYRCMFLNESMTKDGDSLKTFQFSSKYRGLKMELIGMDLPRALCPITMTPSHPQILGFHNYCLV